MSSSKTVGKPELAPRGSIVKTAQSGSGGDFAAPKIAAPSVIVEGKEVYLLDPQARIAVIRQGIPVSVIGNLSSRMGITKESLLSSLGLSRATISRKEKHSTVLSKNESERVLGVGILIGMVQAMVEQSGDSTGFDPALWVSGWLTKSLPALAGATPASYMDTFEGQKLVTELLSISQSGAYA